MKIDENDGDWATIDVKQNKAEKIQGNAYKMEENRGNPSNPSKIPKKRQNLLKIWEITRK